MQNNNRNSIFNAMTVDVEDYYQVSAFSENISTSDWGKMETRVVRNTNRILQMFSDAGIKATFFTLGWVAEREPGLVRSIAEQGHEVACHGYSHQLIYNQKKSVFREETLRAKKLLEDQVQVEVLGYRAASYSITEQSRWAIDVLIEAGFKYDSSIFPVRHDRYGMPDAPKFPYFQRADSAKSIAEFPLSTLNLLGYRLPIAGGGYFRLYPYLFSQLALASINKFQKKPFIFYLHPWEIDPEQPRINASVLSKFRHYNNLDKCESRLKRLLEYFNFCTAKEVLIRSDMLNVT